MQRFDPLRVLLIAMLAIGLMVAGCSDDDDPVDPVVNVDEFAELAKLGDDYFLNYVTPNSGEALNISAMDVWTNTAGDPASVYYIIDYRSADAFAAGHLEGAVNMQLSALVDNLAQLPTDKTILNVCYTGQTASTATAIINLFGTIEGRDLDAVNLTFGMFGWTADPAIVGSTGYLAADPDEFEDWLELAVNAKPAASTYPVLDTGFDTQAEILTARANLYAKGQLNTLAPGKWNSVSVRASASDAGMYARLNDPAQADEWFVVNYFPTTNYEAGHIPGAVQYAPKADILSTAALNTLPKDKKILVYCWTGQTSAQVTAYLNILGYEAYSLSKGVNDMCYSNPDVTGASHQFQPATTNLPVVP